MRKVKIVGACSKWIDGEGWVVEIPEDTFVKQIKEQAIKEFAERLREELIEGIDSNMRCMDKQKELNELWHNCLGKKTACQGILDIVEGYVEEMTK